MYKIYKHITNISSDTNKPPLVIQLNINWDIFVPVSTRSLTRNDYLELILELYDSVSTGTHTHTNTHTHTHTNTICTISPYSYSPSELSVPVYDNVYNSDLRLRRSFVYERSICLNHRTESSSSC